MLKSDLLLRLADLQAWRGGDKPFGLLDYVCCTATPDALFAIAELLMPELLEHEGSFFIAERFELEAYRGWRAKGTDPKAIQRVVNHLHLATLLQNQDVDDEVAHAAATLIASTWSRVFEKKGLVGEVFGETYDDLEVTLVAR